MSVGEFLLWQELHGFLECHDDILIDIGLGYLAACLVLARREDLRGVVYDRHIAERAYEVEVCHGFPYEAFSLALLYCGL